MWIPRTEPRPLSLKVDAKEELLNAVSLEHSTSALTQCFSGVVFNEMKGAFSSADMLYWTRSHQLLHPDTTYQHVSGGEPLAILDLSYEELRDFHCHHYHPSNSK